MGWHRDLKFKLGWFYIKLWEIVLLSIFFFFFCFLLAYFRNILVSGNFYALWTILGSRPKSWTLGFSYFLCHWNILYASLMHFYQETFGVSIDLFYLQHMLTVTLLVHHTSQFTSQCSACYVFCEVKWNDEFYGDLSGNFLIIKPMKRK